jgi:branched-chain amino acid transport system substrate-binding protein
VPFALASACSSAGAPSDAPRSDALVGIGVAFNPARPGMAAVERGATLAVDALNTTAFARVRGVRFVLRPTPAGVTGAVAAAERLRDDPTVIGVVGDAESGRTLDALPVFEDAAGGGARAVVAVTPTATSPALVGRSPWLFRVSPDDGAASRAAAAYATDSLRARRAAVGYLAALRPDVVLFPGSDVDAAPFVRALRAVGVAAPFVGGDAVAPLADSTGFDGVRYTVPFTAERAVAPGAPEAGREFVARYTARYGDRPGVRAALAYEATLLVGRAALAVDLGAADRRALVRDHLAGLGRTTAPAAGVVGPVAFDADHGVVGRGVLVATVGRPPAAAPRPAGSGR